MEATPYNPATARLDRETENELYALYRAFFHTAEIDRRWSLWDDVDWNHVSAEPSASLVDGVREMWRLESFFPDFYDEAITRLRASRGRAWFLTRWVYEESKHQLALSEWLVKAKIVTDQEILEEMDELLSEYRWESPVTDGISLLTDALAWEQKEIARYEALKTQADVENEGTLSALLTFILRDERAQEGFLTEALAIIAKRY